MTDFVTLDPFLVSQLANGQLAHAYIFQGDRAYSQAVSLAAALCCREEGAKRPCGHCPVCLNIKAGSYPDCHLIGPDKGTLRIDAMRLLSMQAQMASIDGEWQIFIIEQAETLTDEAANKVLKLLEEPPAGTLFILISQQPEALLPTILSRCQLFVFGTESSREASAPDEQLLAEAEQFLLDLPGMPLYEVLLLSRQREKREQQYDFLFALLHILHRAATGRIKLPMSYAHLLRSETMVESSLELMNNNVNQKLLTDVVYLRLWQNSQY